MPERFQLSRQRGWTLPPNTVRVARPSRYGNPFRVTYSRERDRWLCDAGDGSAYPYFTKDGAQALAVRLHREYLLDRIGRGSLSLMAELRGKNVACWCGLGEPCHGDTWLELANSERWNLGGA